MDIPNFIAERLASALKSLVDELEGMEDLCPSYNEAKSVLDDAKFWACVGHYCKGDKDG